jgi:hypothetical protein
LGSRDRVQRRAERVEVRAGRSAHHLQRDPIGAVRNFWDYRRLVSPSKGPVKFGIERHSPKASGRVRGPPIYRWGRPHAGRLAHHLQRDPIGALRNLWDYRRLVSPSKVLVRIGIERHGRKASGTGRGPPMYRGCRQDRRALGSHHLQRDPIGAVRNLWDN